MGKGKGDLQGAWGSVLRVSSDVDLEGAVTGDERGFFE